MLRVSITYTEQSYVYGKIEIVYNLYINREGGGAGRFGQGHFPHFQKLKKIKNKLCLKCISSHFKPF